MSTSEIILILLVGLVTGIINTLAGNGSSITLALLIFLGLPADAANATNRIGALSATVVGVSSLRRNDRIKILFQQSLWFVIPVVIGSIAGAFWAIEIDPAVLKTVIGFVMLGLLITLVFKPQKWQRPTDTAVSRKKWYNWLLMLAIGIYAGFLQMGIGIMLLSVLVLICRYSLRDGNIVKIVLALFMVAPAFFVFLFSGDMYWIYGLLLAGGQAVGAFLGARYILFLPAANVIIRWLLIAILSVSSVFLLEIPRLVQSLF